MDDTQIQKVEYLNEANIEDPRILCEQVLKDGIFNGTLTFPVWKDTEDMSTQAQEQVTKTIPFLLSGEFGFSLGNRWESIVPEGVGDMLSRLGNLASMTGLVDLPNIKFLSQPMSLLTWQGSDTPTFTIETTFVSTRRSYNPVEIIKAIAATCLPYTLRDVKDNAVIDLVEGLGEKVLEGVQALSNKFNLSAEVGEKAKNLTGKVVDIISSSGMYAPLLYHAKPNFAKGEDPVKDTRGTIDLQIGTWFKATKLVVDKINNIQFSRQTVAPVPDWHNSLAARNASSASLYSNAEFTRDEEQWGFPLFVKCSLTLRPITVITKNDFMKYFLSSPTRAIPSTGDVTSSNKTKISMAHNAIDMEIA